MNEQIMAQGFEQKDFVGPVAMPENYTISPRGGTMELRHPRYFVAVAEGGNLTLAAEKRLHTAQPSLSRQIRDLAQELGVTLLTRNTRGVELTAAGQVFLDGARRVFAQIETASVQVSETLAILVFHPSVIRILSSERHTDCDGLESTNVLAS